MRPTARKNLSEARSIVLKIGSGVLVREGTRFDRGTFCRIVETISQLIEKEIVLSVVSSGAVALGRGKLNQARPDRARSLPLLQALAAVGQTALMERYDNELAHYGLACGQVLLTREDTDDRTRYLNSRRTLRTLHELGVVPIINENDTITTDEIRLGDNDQLAARVATLLAADLLVIFSDVEGLYTADPRKDPTARRISEIPADAPELLDFVGETENSPQGVGTGGMITKIEAAQIAAQRGIPTLILSGKDPSLLFNALDGEDIGTLLIASEHRQKSRKAWISALRVKGQLHCDSGATTALMERGRSLLPSGIHQVDGRFNEGDAVELVDPKGRPFATGLTLYSSSDIQRIAGRQSKEIGALLGYHVSDVVIHRDDLVLCH